MGVKREDTAREENDNKIVLSRDGDGLFLLTHTTSGKWIQVDERTASKLILMDSLGETEKSLRLASRSMSLNADSFRLDTALRSEVEKREMDLKREAIDGLTANLKLDEWKGKNHSVLSEEKEGREISRGARREIGGKSVTDRGREADGLRETKGKGRNSVLDAHITGVGAAGDFHLTAHVKDEQSGKVREVKGMITGLDAAHLRSNADERDKEETIMRNAKVLAGENFEKGMSSILSKNNSVTMKME